MDYSPGNGTEMPGAPGNNDARIFDGMNVLAGV
jgi:hypothetical protein